VAVGCQLKGNGKLPPRRRRHLRAQHREQVPLPHRFHRELLARRRRLRPRLWREHWLSMALSRPPAPRRWCPRSGAGPCRTVVVVVRFSLQLALLLCCLLFPRRRWCRFLRRPKASLQRASKRSRLRAVLALVQAQAQGPVQGLEAKTMTTTATTTVKAGRNGNVEVRFGTHFSYCARVLVTCRGSRCLGADHVAVCFDLWVRTSRRSAAKGLSLRQLTWPADEKVCHAAARSRRGMICVPFFPCDSARCFQSQRHSLSVEPAHGAIVFFFVLFVGRAGLEPGRDQAGGAEAAHLRHHQRARGHWAHRQTVAKQHAVEVRNT
jgi:hypothetical protein